MTSKFRKLFYLSSVIILILLFSINAFLYTQQPNMLFYPVKEVDVTPKEWGLAYDPVVLNLAGNAKISGWFLPHPQADKTVLFFHGNGGNISHRGNSLYILHKLKLNVLIIDYAGYGESEGTASERGMYQSANAAWEYLILTKKLKPKDIIIFGRSLGGAVAVDLASRVRPAGVILESTFSSVRDVVDVAFPVMSDFIYLRYAFDSFSKIHKVTAPVLVIHSPDDDVIPFVVGKKLFDGIISEKKFLQIEGGHNDGFMTSIAVYMRTLGSYIQSI